MREVLFRAKSVDTGEWVEGSLFRHDGIGVCIHSFDMFYETRTFLRGALLSAQTDLVRVIPDTVGEYTGLTDNNGKKIFEGDIVKDKWNGLGIIEYSENNGCWLSIPCEDGLYQCFKDGDIDESDCSNFNVLIPQGEIIGNIYDNPELLEEGAE